MQPIDLSLKDKYIAFCPKLPFGISSLCSHVNIEAMNIISSYAKITNYLLSQKKLFYQAF